MMDVLTPPGISQAAWDARPESWITDFWFYDPTTRVMVKRRSRADTWTAQNNVSPAAAHRHLNAAAKLMAKWCVQNGYSTDDADALLNWYRSRDPDA